MGCPILFKHIDSLIILCHSKNYSDLTLSTFFFSVPSDESSLFFSPDHIFSLITLEKVDIFHAKTP